MDSSHPDPRRPSSPLARLAAAAGLALAALLVPAAEAAAQGSMMRGPIMRQDPDRPNRAPPAALPGMVGRRAAPVIPADPSVGNLAPNEALFDAINRNDMAATREAISRGANIDARNVLGLTPIDSAVDQGRTEIMFYLLSVRGAARGGSGPPPEGGEGAPGRPPSAAERRARQAAAAREEAAARQRERAQPAANRAGPAPAAAPRTPRLWAGDGGAPIPSVGFLGFDAGRPAGGGPEGGGRTASGRAAQGRG